MLRAAFAIVAAPYVVALWSPLRLSEDSVAYIALADGIRLPNPYPGGYPSLLDALSDVGLGTPAGFVGLNLLLLAAGLLAVYAICRRALGLGERISAVVCLGTLLAHVTSFYSTIPMTDVPYFGVAMVCLLALVLSSERTGWRRWGLIGVGALLAVGGMSLRTAGAALVPPVLFAALGPELRLLLRRSRAAAAALVAGSLALVVAAAVVFVKTTTYYSLDVGRGWRLGGTFGDVLDRWTSEITQKLVSLGEVGAQVSCCTRVSSSFRPGFALAGVAVIGVVVLGSLTRRRFGLVEVFLISTAAVVLVYPAGVARFWIAVLPFMLAYALIAAKRLAPRRPLRYALLLYAAAFTVAGGAWLVESVRVSTSESHFARWAEDVFPHLAPTYRVAYGHPRPGDAVKADDIALGLLRRYGPPR